MASGFRYSYHVVVVLLSGLLLQSQPARSDEYWHLVNLTCSPELGLFTLTSLGYSNPRVEDLEKSKNLFTAERLRKSPFTCVLSDEHVLEVKGLCETRHAKECTQFGHGPIYEAIEIYFNGATLELKSGTPPRTQTDLNQINIGWSSLLHDVVIEGRPGRGALASAVQVIHCIKTFGYAMMPRHSQTDGYEDVNTTCSSSRHMPKEGRN